MNSGWVGKIQAFSFEHALCNIFPQQTCTKGSKPYTSESFMMDGFNFVKHTVCPGSSYSNLYSNSLYKLSQLLTGHTVYVQDAVK